MFSFLFFSFSSLALYAQKSFCFSDFYGRTTKIKLMDKGQGKIIIEENNKVTRDGTISWTITNNHFPNPENIFIRLSTGIILKFEAINSNPPYGEVNMLIDTSGNQYLLCPNENSYARHSGNNNKYFESDDNRCYSWTRARALEKVNYITKNS